MSRRNRKIVNSHKYSPIEKVKPPQDGTALPDLKQLRLSMPRKNNKNAAKMIANGDLLWDKRRVEKVAKREARKLQKLKENRPTMHLDKRIRLALLENLPDWTFDNKNLSFTSPTPATVSQQFLESFRTVKITEPVNIKVRLLNIDIGRELLQELPSGSIIIITAYNNTPFLRLRA